MKLSKANENLIKYRDHYNQYRMIFSSTPAERLEELVCLKQTLDVLELPYGHTALEIFAGSGETRSLWDLVFSDRKVELWDTDIFGKETGRTQFQNFYQGDIINVLETFVKEEIRFSFIYVPINSLLTECINTETMDADFKFVGDILDLASQITDYIVFNCEDSQVIVNDGQNIVLEKFLQIPRNHVPEYFPDVKTKARSTYTFKAKVSQTFFPLKGIYRWSVSDDSGLYEDIDRIKPVAIKDVYKFGDSSHLRSLVESLSIFRLINATLNDLYGNYVVVDADLESNDFEVYRPRMFVFQTDESLRRY